MTTKDLAKALGRRGGRARAKRLSADERRRIASLGGLARADSLYAAKQGAINRRYAEAVTMLRGGRPKIVRMRHFDGPLPGIYVKRD